MLEEALAIGMRLQHDSPGRTTLMLTGELSKYKEKNQDFVSGEVFNVVRDKPLMTENSLYRLLGVGPLAILRTLLKIQRRRRCVDRELAIIRPDVLIVFEDRVVDPEMIWLERAERMGIPALLIRYAASSAESDAWSRKNRMSHSLERGPLAPVRRLFARRYPAHALNFGMGAQLFFSFWDSVALALAGMARTNPWVAGGGRVTNAALQGDIDFDEASQLSGCDERFQITGQPSWDKMADLAQQKYRLREMGEISGVPVLICALPQWGEHLQLAWQDHIKKIEQLSALLERSGCKVVLSLHPKTQREIYQPIADRYNLQISDHPLSVILPGADLFIASWSSTLRWAAMLGIPSVNLDWAQQRYTLFSRLTSLPTSEGPEDLGPLLSRLVDNASIRQSLGEGLKEESSAYGSVDGQAGQRILSLIKNIVARGNHG